MSTLPANANGSSPARPVYFQSLGSAESAAHRAARHQSPTQRVNYVEFAPGILRAVEGGVGYEVRVSNLDYEVVELSAAEVTRRQQSGIRARVSELGEKARQEDRAAIAARTETFVRVHAKWAREARAEVRDLELRLLVSGVRPAGALADGCEPVTSAELDSRHAEAL